MKTLIYKLTPNGSKILIKISPANINPLETKAVALRFAQALPEFEGLKTLFDEQEKHIKTYQRTARLIGGPKVKQLSAAISQMQTDLEEVAAEYAKENPVYLTPANSILVEDSHAAAIKADLDNSGGFIGLEFEGESLRHIIYTGENMGKKFRLPNSLVWQTLEHPDETIPKDALFTVPTDAESEALDLIRIKALTTPEKETELAMRLRDAENDLIRSCALATELDTSPDKAKKAAKAVYDKAVEDIGTRYSA